MKLGSPAAMSKNPPSGPADARSVGLSVEELEDELEKSRAGYAALVQAVQTIQIFKDVDINWDEFPSVTLSAAHEENQNLRAQRTEAQKALLGLKYVGGCFCTDTARLRDFHGDHSPACIKACTALAALSK